MMYTPKDAIIMRNLLINRFEFLEEDIHLLTDRNRNEHQNYANVLYRRLRDLTKGLGVDDTFVLFYSGHGKKKNNRSYISTPDNTILNSKFSYTLFNFFYLANTYNDIFIFQFNHI